MPGSGRKDALGLKLVREGNVSQRDELLSEQGHQIRGHVELPIVSHDRVAN